MGDLIELALTDPRSLWVLLGLAAGLVLLLLAINQVPLTYTLRNLSLRRLTTLMTALAFTAVVGLMVVMLAFTTGMQRMTEGLAQPGNVVILAEGAIDEAFSNLTLGDLGEIEQLPGVSPRHGIGPAVGEPRNLSDRQATGASSPAGPARRPLPAGPRHHRRGHRGQGPQHPTAKRRLVLGGGRGGPIGDGQQGRPGDPGRVGRGRGRRAGRRPHCGRTGGSEEPPPAGRGRSLPPGREGLCRHGDPEIVRRDLQFRDLGQSHRTWGPCSAKTT